LKSLGFFPITSRHCALGHRVNAQVERLRDLHEVLRLLVRQVSFLVLRRAHQERAGRDEGEAHADAVDQPRHHRPHPGGQQLRQPRFHALALVGRHQGIRRTQPADQPHQLGSLALPVLLQPVGQGQPGRLVGRLGV
jgi:hypothetical protein